MLSRMFTLSPLHWSRAFGSFMLAVGVGASAFAASTDSDEALRQRLAELEARLGALDRHEADRLFDASRREEVRALIQDVLADADARGSLLGAGGLSFAAGEGFTFTSADASYSFKLGGFMQARYVFNHRDGEVDDSSRGGFDFRRIKYSISGTLADPGLRYSVSTQFERDGGLKTLSDAFIERDLGDSGLTFRLGQFKPNFIREEWMSATRQLAVDRTLLAARFGPRRVQGMELRSNHDHVRFAVTLSDGFRSLNTEALARDTEFAITGRVDVKLAGEWNDFRDFSGLGLDQDRCALLIGGAIHHQVDEYGTLDDEVKTTRWTVDVAAKTGAFAFYMAAIGNHLSGDGDGDQYGVMAQVAYWLNNHCEVFGRYEWGDEDGPGDDLSVLTLGVSRYFHGSAVKWTTDVGYGFNGVSAFWAAGTAGWRADGADEDGQVVIRSQLQVVF